MTSDMPILSNAAQLNDALKGLADQMRDPVHSCQLDRLIGDTARLVWPGEPDELDGRSPDQLYNDLLGYLADLEPAEIQRNDRQFYKALVLVRARLLDLQQSDLIPRIAHLPQQPLSGTVQRSMPPS